MIWNQSIGAVNTVIRRPIDGKLVGYNTDCESAISAIEDALRGIFLNYFVIYIFKELKDNDRKLNAFAWDEQKD